MALSPPVWVLSRLRLVHGVAAGFALILFAMALSTEQMFETRSYARIGIALSLYVAVAAFGWMVTRRLGVSALAAAAFIGGLGVLSKLKFAYIGATLHVLDIYMHLGSPVELFFFAVHQPGTAAMGVATLIGLALMARWLWRTERASHWPRLVALPLVIAPAMAASSYAASPRLQAQMLHAHFYDGYHLTGWFCSLFRPIDNVELARNFPGEPPSMLAASAGPAPASAPKPPNIILILHESTIDPRPYRPDERTRFKDDPFVSGDGLTRRLIVETFGGRTWISEYGVMLGLSMHYFTPNQAFLGSLLEGKMRNSLAHALGRQGYGSTYVYPAPKTFANTGRFYHSLGFERVLEDTSREPSFTKRDRDYYERAIADLQERRATGSTAPQFTFVMTAATHFPWAAPAFPDLRADEIKPGDPWAEFSRRVRIAHDDYLAFKDRLAVAFPDEAFLLVGFGDHHPTLTADLIPDTDPAKSPRYETFYRLDGVNFAPDFNAGPKRIEIGYLATVMMATARLTLDRSFALRRDTMAACNGLLHRCPEQGRIMAMHRALVERGDVVPSYNLAR